MNRGGEMSRPKAVLKLFRIKTDLKNTYKNLNSQTFKEPLFLSKADRKIIEDPENDEYQYIFKWDVKSISSIELEFKEKKVPIVTANALIEFPKRKKKNSIGNLLPKSERINDDFIKVIFFENNQNTYALINTSNEAHCNRVRKLIGSNNILNLSEDYILDEDMFNWLFYINKECKRKLNDAWTVDNITGFTGNVVDEDNIFKGVSDYTTDLIITKAFISNMESLTNVTVKINTTNADLIFSIDNKSNVTLFVNRSTFYFDSTLDDSAMIVYLYTVVIPELSMLYEFNKIDFLLNKKTEFFKKMGLEVIESIIKKNKISLEDLTKIYTINDNEKVGVAYEN